MIERGVSTFAPKSGDLPAFAARERAVLDCGCAVWVGVRLDTKETATGAASCGPAHGKVMERFNELMAESLKNPTDRLLIEVVDEFLTQAGEECA